MVYNKVLRALVCRAAAYNRPFNSHDSLLILKSLHTLRYRSSEVKVICEKCAFAIASAHISVPVERVIEALNALTSLQAGSKPVVWERLAARLLEVTTRTASPQAVQKAAVVVVKLGRRYGRRDVAEHIFDVLMELLPLYPQDVALRLAVISVFPYTVSNNGSGAVSIGGQIEGNTRVDGVLNAALHLVETGTLRTVQGNSALQALHMYPVIAWCWKESGIHGCQVGDELANPTDGKKQGLWADPWVKVKNAFFEDLRLHTVVPGGYAQFLHDFLSSCARKGDQSNDYQFTLKLLGVALHRDFKRALNSYDVAKMATVVSGEVQRHGRYLEETQRGEQKDQGVVPPRDEISMMLLRVVESLVEQVQFFYNTSWSCRNQVGNTGNRVDQVVIGAVWGAVQKLVCTLPVEPTKVKALMEMLVGLTSDTAGDLQSVWSWVFYSMSMCARTPVFTEELSQAAKKVVKESSILRNGDHMFERHPFSMRSAVQALYAVALWVPDGVTKKGAGEKQINEGHPTHWGPAQLLADKLVKHLEQCRYKEYLADDLPMLLRALVNLTEAGILEPKEHSSALKLVENVLYYMKGLRDDGWCHRHGINVCCSLVSLGEYLLGNELVTDVVKYLASGMSVSVPENLEELRRLLRCMLSLKHSVPPAATDATTGLSSSSVTLFKAVADCILPVVVETVQRICGASKSNSTGKNISLALSVTELASKLGATLTFTFSANKVGEIVANGDLCSSRTVVELNVPALLEKVQMTAADSAHMLYLISFALSSVTVSQKMCRESKSCILRLRQAAISDKPPGSMRVETLVHLLRANAKLPVSKILFDERDLLTIMEAVCYHLTSYREKTAVLKRGGDAERVVHALVYSQVLLRLKRTLKSYAGLMETVSDILSKMEAEQTETPETLFQLRLLCDAGEIVW
ncbi:hypothetical protein, conserved [Trypanosoma brucei gambiense DAL972]|uniref:Uncharacterized protein n=1 Tax=Trypanosoma brucei gambiense (strain MHOM/CI/86/DAL972) TaxID=679716 RepID=D0A8T1_TRYB9|nr:hypothetical protein, conserved [Trypanosoma brucei gambiense DAL972]CBH18082.1 hypothetical protein, conserved [Trypanosoma brucei gambiense DAL972]|eukprot:XP_011780346.1 hypothetical protein, conserved [Trypanosoma brucei gambiense DAL972]